MGDDSATAVESRRRELISKTILGLGELSWVLARRPWTRAGAAWAEAQFERGKQAWRDIDSAALERALRRLQDAALAEAQTAIAAVPRPASAWTTALDDLGGVLKGALTLEDVRRYQAREAARREGVRQTLPTARSFARRASELCYDPRVVRCAVDATGMAGWGAALAESGEHLILATVTADVAHDRARAEAATRLMEVLVREMDAAAGLGPVPAPPRPPTDEEIEADADRLADRPPAAACAELGADPAREDRLGLAERLVAEGKVVDVVRRPAVPLVVGEWWCPLAVFGRDIYDEQFCPDDLMPAWLADLVMQLGEGLGQQGLDFLERRLGDPDIDALCAGLAARARAWPALDAAAWERIEFDLLDAAVAAAKASADLAPRAAVRRMGLSALKDLRSSDPERRYKADQALSELPGRGPAATEARLLAHSHARVAADNAAARRDPQRAASHNCAWAVMMAAEAAGQAAWAGVMAEGGVQRSAGRARHAHAAARAETCRTVMTRLFARMDEELARAPA